MHREEALAKLQPSDVGALRRGVECPCGFGEALLLGLSQALLVLLQGQALDRIKVQAFCGGPVGAAGQDQGFVVSRKTDARPDRGGVGGSELPHGLGDASGF